MVNLLGDLWFAGRSAHGARARVGARCCAPAGQAAPVRQGASRGAGRKMGHVTCLGASIEDALATARAIKALLGIPGAESL